MEKIKKNCQFKLSQGDVNIYLLKEKPELFLKDHEGEILVTGDGGHNHSVSGALSIKKTGSGQFLVEVGKNGAIFKHDGKHQPPFDVDNGFYLVDRAREKGMLSDMIGPVAD